MKKIYLLLTLFAFAGMVSCEDDDAATGFDPEKDIVVDRGVDPGTEYAVEKNVKYVDVFYYIPKGMTAVNDWHWRLSGITTHVQDFFANNLKKYYQVNKKFEVIRNVANPKYVKIHYLQGNVDLTDVRNREEKDLLEQKKLEIIADIQEFWKTNPSEKTGHHHLVFLPEDKIVDELNLLSNVDDFFAFLPYDKPQFDIKYFDYNTTRKRYLKDLSKTLYYSGLALGTLSNVSYASQYFAPLSAMDYHDSPEMTRLTEADVLSLNQSEAFNPRSGDAKYGAYPTRDEFLIRDVKMETTASFINITCDFLSAKPVVHLLAYEDPWRSIEYDEPAPELDMNRAKSSNIATVFYSELLESVGMENGRYVYHAAIRVPVSFIYTSSKKPIENMEYAKSEFRFKFLLQNGYVFPELDEKYYADAEVHADRFRYQYYWVPGTTSGTYRPYLLTDLRDHNEIVYTSQEVSSVATLAVDGDKTTTWTGSLQNNNTPEVAIKMIDEKSTVDGIRIWAPGDKTPLRISIYATAGGVESIVVDNRLVPGDEAMYKYIEFDRKENVSQLRVRIEKVKENEVGIAEIEVYRKRDNN